MQQEHIQARATCKYVTRQSRNKYSLAIAVYCVFSLIATTAATVAKPFPTAMVVKLEAIYDYTAWSKLLVLFLFSSNFVFQVLL